MTERNYDVVIVGAGPAGCACAFSLRHSLLKIAIIDKGTFPRDKICGDALSADVVNQFYRMDQSLGRAFEAFSEKIDSHGVRFYAPNQESLDIDFINPSHGKAAGYISKRVDFDQFWFDQIKKLSNVDIYEGLQIAIIFKEGENVILEGNDTTFKASMVLGADGAHSVVNRFLGDIKIEKNHYCAGLRQYYEGVSGFHSSNHIELHFYDEILPGYFWIFPLTNGKANVGIGMLSSAISKDKIDLKDTFNRIIRDHSNIKGRFTNAKPLEKIQGYGLPIGSKKRPISGNRFLLLGDAASLIDPFTGEGIGNAMRSGRIAAEHVVKAFERGVFDASFNRQYDKVIYQKMWKELKLGRSLQQLLRYPKLFNYVVKKANKNESLKLLLTAMLDDVDLKSQLTKPAFYWKLLFH